MILARIRTLLIICVAAILPHPSFAATGYTSRPSGMDMNHNGIRGEAADKHVCDGNASTGAFTADPDGDGTNEDINFIDSGVGIDNAACGAPNAPCKTVQFVMDGSNSGYSKHVNGPGDGAEDILCLRGTFNESVMLKQSGRATAHTVAATGNQVYSFEYPKDPLIIMGWDYDRDGDYPPHDTDDVAVMHGQMPLDLDFAFKNGTNLDDAQSYWEIAHLKIVEYGHRCDGYTSNPFGASGAMIMSAGYTPVTAGHLYVHDIELDDINEGCVGAINHGYQIVFHFFTQGTRPTFAAIENVLSNNQGCCYLIRGSAGTAGVQRGGPYYRFQNISMTAPRGRTGDALHGIKMWYIDKVEVLDNDFDLDAAAWSPNRTLFGPHSVALAIAEASANWHVKGNRFKDFPVMTVLEPDAGNPVLRGLNLTNITFDRNYFHNTYTYQANIVIIIGPGYGTTSTVSGNLNFTNNVMLSTAQFQSCLWSNAGNDQGVQPGTMYFVNNTCHGALNRDGWADVVIGNYEGQAQKVYPLHSYVIKNNIFAGLRSTDLAVKTHYDVTNLSMDYNVFLSGVFSWNRGSQTTLAAWRTASGGDWNSKQCTPVFANVSTGNFRLTAVDTCARGAGVPLPSITSWDLDGFARSSTNPSIGAHEGNFLAGSTPARPANVRILRP